jgi:hypothetical protein
MFEEVQSTSTVLVLVVSVTLQYVILMILCTAVLVLQRYMYQVRAAYKNEPSGLCSRRLLALARSTFTCTGSWLGIVYMQCYTKNSIDT